MRPIVRYTKEFWHRPRRDKVWQLVLLTTIGLLVLMTCKMAPQVGKYLFAPLGTFLFLASIWHKDKSEAPFVKAPKARRAAFPRPAPKAAVRRYAWPTTARSCADDQPTGPPIPAIWGWRRWLRWCTLEAAERWIESHSRPTT